MIRTRALAFVAAVLVGTVWTVGAAPAPAGAGPAEEASLLTMVNGLRAAKGLPALLFDERLAAPARTWSAHMASTGVLAHNPDLARQVPSGWTRLGENVGTGSSIEQIHAALVASPSHYANLVSTAYNRIGLGVATGGGRIWLTQTFAAASWPDAPAPPPVVTVPNPSPGAAQWYRLATNDGRVFTFGGQGALSSVPSSSIVGVAATPSGAGAWLAAADGGVFAVGDARFFGSAGGLRLAQPVVGIAARPQGDGYWLVARDGGVFSFGAARFHGSTGHLRLNQPIVGAAPSPSGDGYRFVASDGGVFSFGDAGFFGSTGSMRLNRPVVGMAAAPSNRGYWLVAEDGGIFAFGDAGFHGSTGHLRLNQPIVGMAGSGSGRGYRFVAADGGVFSFGDASFLGSAGGVPFGSRVVGLAAGA